MVWFELVIHLPVHRSVKKKIPAREKLERGFVCFHYIMYKWFCQWKFVDKCNVGMAELVYALALGASGAILEGSSPSPDTRKNYAR